MGISADNITILILVIMFAMPSIAILWNCSMNSLIMISHKILHQSLYPVAQKQM